MRVAIAGGGLGGLSAALFLERAGVRDVQLFEQQGALEEIGGAPAEQAAIALLNRAEDQATKLTALAILEKVGGAETAASLRTYAMAADDPAVRSKAFASAAAIEARVPAPQAP